MPKKFTLLSDTGKMPGSSWSISAKTCHQGAKLRQVKGSTCEKCYALKNRYTFPNVQACLQRRLEHYNANPKNWVNQIAAAIYRKNTLHFRWFDSGDLQSPEMALDIFEVCRRTPKVKHWMPTREYSYITQAISEEPVPPNLTVRLSAHMINLPGPSALAKRLGPRVRTSGVTTDKTTATCPAHLQNNQCGPCRRCWDARVSHVTYPQH